VLLETLDQFLLMWSVCHPDLGDREIPRLTPVAFLDVTLGICMKTHKSNKIQPTASAQSAFYSETSDLDCDLEKVAHDLLKLAKSRLPSGAMRGILAGFEDDVRQEAVLLALSWYRRKLEMKSMLDWNAAQAICAALRYCKLDLIGKIKREQQAKRDFMIHQEPFGEDAMHVEKWSPAEVQSALGKAIRQALKQGSISHVNASIAMSVYIEQIPVIALADQLQMTRGAIYQHLKRVRLAIPDLIKAMR
jgi:hypothetical protein